MDIKNALRAIPMVGFDVNTLGLVYTPINPLGLPEACSVLRIVNASKASLFLSFDCSHDHDFIRSDQSIIIHAQENNHVPGHVARFAKGTIISISGVAAVGYIYVCGYY